MEKWSCTIEPLAVRRIVGGRILELAQFSSSRLISLLQKRKRPSSNQRSLPSTPLFWEKQPLVTDLRPIYGELSYFEVINKPSGIPVYDADPTIVSVKSILSKQRRREVHFPHRIDKWTSGLLIVAYDSITSSKIADALRSGTKKYRVLVQLTPCVLSPSSEEKKQNGCALVHKRVSPLAVAVNGKVKLRPKGSLESFLGAWSDARYHAGAPCEQCKRLVSLKSTHPFVDEQLLHRTHSPNAPGAKEARTKFTLKDYSLSRGIALYEAELLTGRTHQIRVQFSDAGAPVVADPYYNPMFVNYLASTLSQASAPIAPLGISSPLEMGLQAHVLQFAHPHDKAKRVNLRLPAPTHWKSLTAKAQ